jgi:branched-chain amino acid transport system permease protein
MVLLGGIQTVMGPIVGAAAFHSIKDFFMPLTDFWRLFLGISIITMVLAFPRGIAGARMLLSERKVRANGAVEAGARP